MSDKLEGLREARAACVGVGLGAHEAAQAKDATDYVAGYQDGCVDCDEAIRALEQQQASAQKVEGGTPRTDALIESWRGNRGESGAAIYEWESALDLARQLERELAEAKKRGDLYFTDLVKKDSRIRILEASRSASADTVQVPMEATQEMVEAGYFAMEEFERVGGEMGHGDDSREHRVWKAMLAAAPVSSSAPALTHKDVAHLFDVIEDSGVALRSEVWRKLDGIAKLDAEAERSASAEPKP